VDARRRCVAGASQQRRICLRGLDELELLVRKAADPVRLIVVGQQRLFARMTQGRASRDAISREIGFEGFSEISVRRLLEWLDELENPESEEDSDE
jgi:hypothetical protein